MITCAIGNGTYKHKIQILDVQHFLLLRKTGHKMIAAQNYHLLVLFLWGFASGSVNWTGVLRILRYYLLPNKLWTALALACCYEWLSHPFFKTEGWSSLYSPVVIFMPEPVLILIFPGVLKFCVNFSENQRGILEGRTDWLLSD